MTEFKYTIKVQLGSEDCQSFDGVEKKLRNAALSARELCSMVFPWFESQWQSTHKNYRHKGREEAVFKTTFGEVEFSRLRVTRHGENLFPLDQWIGIESKDRCSPRLRERIVEESVTQSFRTSAKSVQKSTASLVNPMVAWRVVQREGGKHKKKQEAALGSYKYKYERTWFIRMEGGSTVNLYKLNRITL